MLFNIYNIIQNFANDKIVIGICIIFLNIASRYIDLKLSKNQELLIQNLGKEVLVFFIAFIGTRDIITSLILTGIYWLFINIIFNEKSNLCVLPKNLKQLNNVLDINKDNYISQEEIDHALQILQKSKRQETLKNQFNLMNNT